MNTSDDLVTVGKVSTVYGVKGWVKLYSYTDPMTNLLEYREVFMKRAGQWQPVTIVEGRRHGKTLIAALEGVDDREVARELAGCELAIRRDAMPELPEDEYYWHQLQGLLVKVAAGGDDLLLGKVDHLLETGANDVLVVKPCEGSLDERERLIPYVPGQFITEIDLAAGVMQVEWDPEF